MRYNGTVVHYRVDDSGSGADGCEVWPVYESVFGDLPDYDTWRDAVWDTHRGRAGFRLARAYDDDVLVGFAYGYTGESGQWWTDNARKVLEPEVAGGWLGGHFEVVSIGVAAALRRTGIGRTLMRTLTDGLGHDRLLLMTTSDPRDPARALYASEGWGVIGPGIGDGTVIMGKRVQGGRATGGPGGVARPP
jgi:ribosomal protein S18 acetylase RimI-like enzyme